MRQPTHIGDWQVIESLGRGGNGIVYAVRRGAAVGAAKVLNTTYADRRRRFDDEIATMRRCADIPGVLPILDCYTGDDSKPWFVMGRAVLLKEQLGGAPSLRSCVEAVRDIAFVLARIHARGLSHRDVKPENLFYFEGRWSVGDFGLAHFPGKSAITEKGERIGPVYYIAPEMLNYASASDGRPADVFSLGKTLWVLATGLSFPLPGEYFGTSDLYLLSKYIAAERTAPLDALISASTRITPASRPTMEQFEAELTAWLDPVETSRAPISLNLGQYVAQMQRQQTLLDAKRKNNEYVAAARTRHGMRMRELLRPLGEDLAKTLHAESFDAVQLSIENIFYGFDLTAVVPHVSGSGVRLRLSASVAADDQKVQLHARYTVQSLAAHSALEMVVWSKQVEFLPGGSQEPESVSAMDAAVREHLQPAVDAALKLAFAPDVPDPNVANVPGGVTVLTEHSALEGATVTLLLPNGLYDEAITNSSGRAAFSVVPTSARLRAFVTHPNYPGLVTESTPLHGTFIIRHDPAVTGSLVATSGWTALPRLGSSLNFIHDAQNRRYVYAPRMTINGNTQQPAAVELGAALSFTDVQGNTLTLVPKAFHGACFLLDICH